MRVKEVLLLHPYEKEKNLCRSTLLATMSN